MATRIEVIVAALLFSGGVTIHAQGTAKVKVGDWVEYKQTDVFGKQEIIIKKTVKELKDKKVTVHTEATDNGKAELPVDKEFSLEQLTESPAKNYMEYKIESGKETIRVGSKDLSCKWTSYKIPAAVDGKTPKTILKIWISHDVALDGMVRSEIETMGAKQIVELTGYGRGK